MESDEYRRIAEAEEAHWWYVAMRRILQTLAGDELPERAGRFLDAGCGPGGNAVWMAERGEVFGVDVMPEAIEFASVNHPSLKLTRATVEALPFADESFDAVQSITMLYHEGVKDEKRALREYLRVLRPRGVALIAEPAFNLLRRDHDRVVHGARRYRRQALARLAADAGFEIERSTYAYSYLFPVALALATTDRMKRSRGNVDDAQSDLERGQTGAAVFTRLAAAESAWLKRGFRIPFGVSTIVIARRPLRAAYGSLCTSTSG